MAATCLSYYPNEQDASRFWQSQQLRERTPTAVPAGYPQELKSALAWTRDDASKKQSEWVLKLESEDIAAIHAALENFQASHKSLSEISTQTFQLPQSLAQKLKQISNQCYNGLGFQILRGIDPSQYTPEQNVIIYAGVSSHIGSQRGFTDGYMQKAVVSHVVNVNHKDSGRKVDVAPGFTDSPLAFHTDNCEIMGLYCLDTAVKGGGTRLASSWNVYNQLAAIRPEVLHALAETWTLDTFKDYNVWKPLKMPLLDRSGDNNVLLRFSRYPIIGWKKKRNADLPPPTQAQLEAIDAVQFIAEANSIAFSLVKGDMLFVNDMAVMHGRESFDEGDTYMKRHLLKMFIHDPEQQWPVAPSARELWSKMYGSNKPNGGRDETWHVYYGEGQEKNSMVNG